MRPFVQYQLGHRAITGVVDLNNETLETDTVSPTLATCTITYNSDGSVTSSADNAPLNGRWNTASGVGSNYDIRVTPTSGTMSTGPTGSWLNLGTNRSWSVLRSSTGTKVCVATVEIRDAVSLSVLDSCSITLTAFMEAP